MFNENMTYDEAQGLFFRYVDGKSKDEIAEIKRQYKAVLPAIIKRELVAGRNCLTEYKI